MRGPSGWAGGRRSQWRERSWGKEPGRAKLGAGAVKRELRMPGYPLRPCSSAGLSLKGGSKAQIQAGEIL